jgi:hypothetical protein
MWAPAPNHPDGTHIGLTNGTTFLVTKDREGVVVPPAFRKEAIARGCILVGMEPDTESPEAFNRDVLIRTKMESMLHSDDPGYFDSMGKPSLTVLGRLCGFTVDRMERDKLWAEVEAGTLGKGSDDE